MPSLTFNQYGKTEVRLTQLLRNSGRHDIAELSVQILFQGDFARSYTDADNSVVLPTDTIKNTVYVLARQHPILAIESFARQLAKHFLSRLTRLEQIHVSIEQMPWARMSNHNSAFILSGKERRITKLIAARDNETVTSGVYGLEILKTSHSAFAGFAKDELTTLAETNDRLLGTVLDADWTYRSGNLDFNVEYARIRSTLLDIFANHASESVQHTLYDMAIAALRSFDALTEVHLTMPNRHRILVDLSKFGLDNPNQIFLPLDQPSGHIEARVSRE
jgi:urate oxidase